MGWKSTENITREKAIQLINDRLEEATNDELGYTMEAIGYGDNPELKYYGCNFWVMDNLNDE